MDNNQLSNILLYVLIGMVVLLFVMLFIYVIILLKGKKEKKSIETDRNETNKEHEHTTSISSTGNILDFMDFETIEDNMIVKKERQKYLMVIECQGVNYDLMSGVEKVGVEQGFLQFLNTLRYPIQLYIQTRSINLEKSIAKYKDSLKNIETNYVRRKMQYDQLRANSNVSEEDKQKAFYELTKIQNLYEYGQDVIKDTERMSLNKSILNKKYYIVIAYNYENINGDEDYDKEEIRSMAFSDLYTKAQSIIRTLSACSVSGKIMNSVELAELLYMAYNRDGAEAFGIERALKASYDKLYSTAPDVFVNKVKALDKEIEEKAVQEAQQELATARQDIKKEIERKEREKEKLIDDMAKIILESNKKYVGNDVADKAIENIDKKSKARTKTKAKGGKVNAREEKETTKSAK